MILNILHSGESISDLQSAGYQRMKNNLSRIAKLLIRSKTAPFGWTVASISLVGLLVLSSSVRAYTALPGAEKFAPALMDTLGSAVTEKGKGYIPRTKYKNIKNKAKYVNRLILEASPYLQQHAHNPVNWYPWGEEAFAEAKRLNRPVLVSIGYSTCHWCHVMEEESYDNEETAKYLNENFIAIKVDREVRPDIDEIYMTAIHAMKQKGGWPLNVWLTPDKQPFYGGTYFTPEESYGRPAFMTVLTALKEAYHTKPEEVASYAKNLTNYIRQYQEASGGGSDTDIANIDNIGRTKHVYEQNFDFDWGGLQRQTKFPASFSIRLMMRYFLRSGDRKALDMANLTLESMARGGMHDQIGGGFHRYSTDPQWLVPHFEKMLYDNALLAVNYIEAWQLTKNPFYEKTARKTLDYILREMTSPEGGFYSATDADSLTDRGEMEEGWYFTWTPAELVSILGKKDAELAAAYFGVTEVGNFEHRNIPQRWAEHEFVAQEFELSDQVLEAKIYSISRKLYQHRRTRPAPLLDDKVLASWNGLTISAMAKAGYVLNEPDYVRAAEKAAFYIKSEMVEGSRLFRVCQPGRKSCGGAFLDDYAFVIAAMIDLYEATFDTQWLDFAIRLQAQQQKHFADEVNGGYFRTADDAEKLLAREKDKTDSALPSGNSIAVLNLLRLYKYTSQRHYKDFALLSLQSFSAFLEQGPLQLTDMLMALDYLHDDVKEIIIVHPSVGEPDHELERVARTTYIPNKILVVNREDEIAKTLKTIPLVEGKKAIGNQSTAYLCYEGICKLPTRSVSELQQQLAEIKPYTDSASTVSKLGKEADTMLP